MGESFPIPDPFALKENGNLFYNEGKYMEAVEVWKSALTCALKQSVRDPSGDLVDLQMKLRLNIAQAFIKFEDYIMAKEHLLVVMDREPTNPKALYRLAQVYHGLLDFEKAIGIARRGIQLHQNDPSFKLLYNELIEQEKQNRHKAKQQGPVLSVDNYVDERSAPPEPCKAKIPIDPTKLKDMDSIKDLTHKVVAWKCKLPAVENPTRSQQLERVDEDIDDWSDGKMWLTPYSKERLTDDRTVVCHSLPFSILYGLEKLLLNELEEGPRAIFEDIQHQVKTPLPPIHGLPQELGENVPVPYLTYEEKAKLLTKLCGEGNNVKPFTIHILNARGDDEMEVKWSSLLERLPGLDRLQCIMVGFNQDDDPYSKSIPAADYISPQLTKSVGAEDRKFICRLYKGGYTEFINSPSVAETTRTTKLPHQKLGQPEIDLPPVLTNIDHPFHPDIVVIPQCNLSRRFDEYLPILAMLLLTDVPVLLLGYSACEMPSHEALQIPGVLNSLKARYASSMYWNPFGIYVKPSPDYPPMSIITREGRIIEDFRGMSGKYSIGIWIKGFAYSEANLSFLCSLLKSPKAVMELKATLSAAGVDVDREEYALKQLVSNQELTAEIKKALDEHESEVSLRTAELTQALREKLAV